MLISVIILTYNRCEFVVKQLAHFKKLESEIEVIFIDNGENKVEDLFPKDNDRFIYIDSGKNIGVAARNIGLARAKGKYIICLDDDVIGIDDSDIDEIVNYFDDNPKCGAICFSVINPSTNLPMNWVHHRVVEEWCDMEFVTYEITEGAVAFRKEVLDQAGYYYERFFISHEGPDLAIRIMNCGYDIVYYPNIKVHHYHSSLGRKDWRVYYYDTRNLIWLVIRHYPVLYGMKVLVVGIGSMFIYSVRDGYLKYWVKAVIDAILDMREVFYEREKMLLTTYEKMITIDKYRPNLVYLIRKKLFKKDAYI